MKSFNRLFLSFLTITMLVACQDSWEELVEKSNSDSVSTRVEESLGTYDYYWFKGEKYYLKRVENKTFILFNAEDESNLLSSLLLSKIEADKSNVKDFIYDKADCSGNAAKTFDNHKWMDINIDIKSACDYPEIVYAAPYYYGPDDSTFPLTNMIYIVLKNTGDYSILEKMSKEYNVGIIGKDEMIPNLYLLSCNKYSKGNALEIANAFYESGLYHISEPVFISGGASTADYYYTDQWNLKHNGQHGYSGFDINFESASIPSTSNIVVAVVDNGVELTHSDLNLNTFSWDAVNQSSPSVVWANKWGRHGTNVAGIISGIKNNTIGIAGITSGISVMSISIDYYNSNLALHCARAIKKATDMGASVINNSWYLTNPSNLVNDAIHYAVEKGRNGKGCVVVISSGNDNLSSMSYPATYTPQSEIIAVGAMTYNGKRKTKTSIDGETNWGSNYGSGLDIIAPGVRIPTTDSLNTWRLNFWGTSSAAPHVSAVAAEILTINSSLKYDEVDYILKNTAEKLSGYTYSGTYGWNSQTGYGLLDMAAALQLASSTLSGGSSVFISGQSSISADNNGYAGTTLSASPYSSLYTYFWTASFYGSCDRWYIWPNGGNADISVYLNPGQTGGLLIATCRVYQNSNYIGSASHYLQINP